MEAAMASFKNIVHASVAMSEGGERAARLSATHEWLRLRLARLLVSEQLQQSSSRIRQGQAPRQPRPPHQDHPRLKASPAVSPSVVRLYLTQSLALYPRSPELLSALEVSEQLGHANVRLRRALHRALEAGPSPQLLAACLRAEAARVAAWTANAGGGRRGGAGWSMSVAALERLLEKATSEPKLAASPLTWQMYIR